MNNVKIISQTVDTIKTHYKIVPTISDEDFNHYLKITKDLISLKKEAQEVKNNYGSTKHINYTFGTHKFNILPTSITGFSIVMKNADFQIALKQANTKINGSPLIKAEFRAEFLARVGYIKALHIVNTFIKEFILTDYEVSISEIHLATDIQGYNFKLSDFARMKTRMRTGVTYDEETIEASASVHGTVTTFTGFIFGKGDYMMRIYDKSKEIQKYKEKSFVKYHLWEQNENYYPDKTVWRLEIQIRKAKLKKMVNSNGNTMDNYHNCLNGIPDLWSKALEDYEIKDVSRENTSNLFHGDRILKNGSIMELTKHSITKIFKRSPSLPFWEELKKWNTHESMKLQTAPKTPKHGSQDYVNNSIKSLYSTLAKHKGKVDSATLVQAFEDANEDNLEKKSISLLEDSFNKQLDWIDLIDEHNQLGVCNTPNYKTLESEIADIVIQSDDHIKNVYYSQDIIDRIEARMNFASKPSDKVIYRDWDYLQSLITRLEANMLFSS